MLSGADAACYGAFKLHPFRDSGTVAQCGARCQLRVKTIVDTVLCVNYSLHMMRVIESETFKRWLRGLRDVRARARITLRVRRLGAGNPGDVKPVGEGLSELRIDYGPGYRVYFMRRGVVVVIVLCGGDKRTQDRDIAAAKRIAAEWKD